MNPPNPILTQGTWKITRGNNIPITYPSWFSLRLGAHTLLHNQVTKVADLINQADATWKADTVRQLYNKNTADLILGIPLPKFQSSQDLFIWPHSIFGHYQVKTAYALLHKDQTQALHAPRPGPILTPKLWKILWKLKLPNKLLTFTWKLLHHALPVKDVLNTGAFNVQQYVCSAIPTLKPLITSSSFIPLQEQYGWVLESIQVFFWSQTLA